MSVIKRWNELTGQWEVAVVGKQGPVGPTGATGPSGPAGDIATATIFDSKGDLAVGISDNAASRLAAGTNGQSLVVNASTLTGLAYEARSASPVPYIPGRAFPKSFLAGGYAQGWTPGYGAGGAWGTPLPCVPTAPIAEVALNVLVAQAGGGLRFGIYGSDALGRPAAGLLATGTASTATTGLKTTALSFTCPTPFLWLFVCATNTAPTWTVAGYNNNSAPDYLNLSINFVDVSHAAVYSLSEDCTSAFPSSPTFNNYGGWANQMAWAYRFG